MFSAPKFAQRFPKNLRVLLDDAGEGDDVDDPFQAVSVSMIQRKGHRGQGLPTSCRDRQGEEARFTDAFARQAVRISVRLRLMGVCGFSKRCK